jgi:hypothetical protein
VSFDPIHIRFGDTAGTVYHDAAEGRASSVTSLTVWEDTQSDTSTSETAFGSAAVETNPSTTFDAASGYSQTDPTKCNLAATTGIVEGRRYLATNAYGENDWVEVQRIDSANAVYARNPLAHDYTTSDTFVSTRISATVNSTWVADESNLSHPLRPFPRWRAAFVYVVGGVTYRAVSHFDLVRYPWHHSVTAVDVDRLSRGWLSRLAVDDRLGQGQAAIDEAAHQVKLALWTRGVADYALRNSAVLNELIKLKAVELVAKQAYMNGGTGSAQMEMAEADYFKLFTEFVDAGLVPVQSDEDGAAAPIDRKPVWRR